MATTALPPTISSAEERFVLDGVDWDFYEHLLRKLDNRRVFVTYDRGRLELMSPSRKHEISAKRLFVLISMLAEELGLSIESGGSTTYRRKDLDRGLEPDDCFYIENEARVRGLDEIDLSKDPPPDLAVEVEISRRLKGREAIYAALGVPQLWRYDGQHLRVFTLDPARKYQQVDRSPTFPALPLDQVDRLLEMSHTMDQTTWTRKVRAWIKQHLIKP
jgi:Uma2 family endonuclease